MPRGILATCSAPDARRRRRRGLRDAYEKAYADEPFVHLLPEGQWPQTKSVARLQRRARAGRPSTRRAGRLVAVGAVDNLAKGTARRRRPVHEPRPRPARDRRASPRSDSPHERHRTPRGFRPPASPPGSSRPAPRTSPWSSTTAPLRLRRRSSPPTAARPTRCCGARRSSRTASSRAVVLNSGGANCYTGAEGFQTTHAVAEQVADGLGIGAGRRRRLLHRPDRPDQRPRRACSPASTRPSPRSAARRRRRTPPRRS